MAKQKTKSGFNKQLNTAFLIGIVFLSITSSFFISYFTYQHQHNEWLESGEAITDSIAAQLVAPVATGSDEEMLSYTFHSYLELSKVQKIVLYNSDFEEVFAVKKHVDYAALIGWQQVSSTKARLERETDNALYFVSRVDTLNQSSSTHYLMVIIGKTSISEYVQGVFIPNTGIIILLALLLLLTIRWVTRQLTKPLEEFSSIMIQAASGETGLRASEQRSTELSYMSESFNQMMEVIEIRRHELEESRDKAMQTAKIKSDFAAHVSHEIRTPLNGILGMVNLLKEMGLPQHQHEYLEVASRSGDTLLQMINDVLDFSKMESGDFSLELKDLDLRLLLEQQALLYAERIQVKDLELCLDLPTDDVVFVRADATRIRQVINNLLSNAIKFTSKGEITISLKITPRSKDRAVIEIAIVDTGIGIPDNALERIFTPFGQVSQQISNNYGGTGLGLTIVKKMTTLMGGHIAVDSTLGSGSNFKISIPMQTYTIDYNYPEKDVALLDAKRVLLIEPFDTSKTYIEGMLSSWGLGFETLASIDEAVAYIKLEGSCDSAPDICLFNIDYSKGDLQGFLRNFQEAGVFAKTKLIPMIRFGGMLNVSSEEGNTFATTIDRPIRHEKLRATLLDVLSESKGATQDEGADKGTLQASEQFKRMKVLVVDDNMTNQLVATATLKELGVQADTAINGQEAITAFKQVFYDLILMDCNMPVMDGYQATEEIRAIEEGSKQVVIIALTAKESEEEHARCLSSGMNDVLLKPFRIPALLKSFEKAFGFTLMTEKVEQPVTSSIKGLVIDEAVYETLALNTGDGLEQIIQTYLIDAPIYIASLLASMDMANQSKILDLTHKIKGSSRNLGAEGLVDVCLNIEKAWAADSKGSEETSDLSEKLEHEFSLVEDNLTHKLQVLESPDSPQKKRTKEIVLIVDDDQSTRMTVASVLEREGYQVELGSNGREAVQLFEMLQPNVVIMDAMMPIKDGFEACKEIKALPSGKDVPVLITTALEGEKSVDLAFQSGAADFVPKPINLSVLRQRVRRLLEKQSAEKHVQKLAYIDSLTGLPNRAAFVEQFQQEIAHAKRSATKTVVFFIDVDDFKTINDSLGHEAGDVLLKAIAGRLKNCIRSGDMLARLGGDEFVVVLSDMDEQEGYVAVAESMLSVLKEPFNIVGNELFASVSIGISIYPEDGQSKEMLLKNADTAMYRAKAAGRNTYRTYTQEMSDVIENRMRVETDLRKVLVDNELSLYYQAKQNMLTGEVIGSEALVRWQHRLRGMVSPAEFIPIAEEMGLIKEIGAWVLDTACETHKKWQQEYGYQGTVAVNVSAVQMTEDNFVESVRACLAKHQLAPEYLELEVTETMVLNDIDAMLEKLNQIRRMGVNISIDDFGTGYSSFSYIKQLPANTLKLDIDFIRDIPSNKEDMAVVDGMIVLAHNLGMKVVAEGVETQGQYNFLAEHKCDLIQGYLVSRPLSEDLFLEKYVSVSSISKESFK